MSAHELIERYGLDDMVAGWVERDIESAKQMLANAATWRMRRDDFASSGETYLKVTPDMHARDYMGQARAIGWRIAQVIDEIVRAEEAHAAHEAAEGLIGFWQGSCGSETCPDCERPMWQHIERCGEPRLCPFGRRYWQRVRALMPFVMGEDRSDDGVMLAMIATRWQ